MDNHDPLETPAWIQGSVLARLKSGQFVPKRQQKQGVWSYDRRDRLSPLAVTKRCIRYDPNVFENRNHLVLKLAEEINDPQCKIVMLCGEQGTGKTSLVRGVVELMGGGPEQLLWFDANRYSDFEEVTQFLLRYIAYLSDHAKSSKHSASPFSSSKLLRPHTEGPFQQLTTMLETLSGAGMPLLIVLDNMEYLVGSDLTLNSQLFKELLNFLLGFDGVKMMMMGERLPYTDLSVSTTVSQAISNSSTGFSNALAKMASSSDGMTREIRLEGLTENDIAHWFSKKQQRNDNHQQAPSTLSRRLYEATAGYPWLIKTIMYLHQQVGLALEQILAVLEASNNQEGQGSPNLLHSIEALSQLIYHKLDPVERQLIQLMVLLRHAASPVSLQAMMLACYPSLRQEQISQTLAHLERSLLRPILKVNYPPQDVLSHLENQTSLTPGSGSQANAFQPSYDVYVQFKKIAYRHIPAFERLRLHESLHQYYTQEKVRPEGLRSTSLKNKSLVIESNFHLQRVQRKNSAQTQSISSAVQPSIPSPDWQAQAYSTQAGSYRGEERTEEALKPRYYANPEDYRPIKVAATELLATSQDILPVPNEISWEAILSPEEKQLLGLERDDFQPQDSASVGHNQRQDLNQLTHHLRQASELSSNASDEQTFSNEAFIKDEAFKLIQQRMTLAVANRNKPELLRQLLALSAYWIEHQQFNKADDCLNKALELDHHEANQSPIPPVLVAEVWYQRGLLFQKQYQFPLAQACFKQGYQILSPLLNAETWQESAPSPENNHHRTPLQLACTITQQLADSFTERTNYPNAKPWQGLAIEYGKALLGQSTAEEKSAHQGQLAEAYFKLGNILDDIHQNQEAITAYQQSVALNQLLVGQDRKASPSLAAALANIGYLYVDLQQFETALDYLKQALEADLLSVSLGDTTFLEEPKVGKPAQQLGNLSAQEEHTVMAVYHTRESYPEISQNPSIPDQSIDDAIHTLEGIAHVYERMAEQLIEDSAIAQQVEPVLSQAEAYFNQALALLETHHSFESPYILKANLYLKLGNIYARKTDPPSQRTALTHYQTARQIGYEELSKDSLDYLGQCIEALQTDL